MMAVKERAPWGLLKKLVKLPPAMDVRVEREKSGTFSTASTGTSTMAQNMRMPWIRSVQQTAKKPPKKV